MKKTQIALAALTLVASTAAMADGVKVSGIIDASIANTTDKGSYLEQGANTSVSSITFSGSEDLGGGMKAFFNLESGFGLNGNAVNGGNNGGLYSRQANVGLSGDFGSITAGLQLSPFIAAAAGSTAGIGNFFVNRIIMGSSAAGCVTNCNHINTGFFISNAVTYATPSIMGYTATFMSSANGGVDRQAASPGLVVENGASDKYTAGSITGPLGAGTLNLAFDDRRGQDQHWLIGGTYPVASGLTLSGSMMNRKTDATNNSIGSYNVGLTYALSEATSLIAQYATVEKGKMNATESATLSNLAITHALSKQTSVYATYTLGDNVSSSIGNRGATIVGADRTVAVGVVKAF